jgi:hypothetical protein
LSVKRVLSEVGGRTPLGVIEDLSKIRYDIFESLVRLRIQFLLHHLKTHGMFDRLVIIGKGALLSA